MLKSKENPQTGAVTGLRKNLLIDDSDRSSEPWELRRNVSHLEMKTTSFDKQVVSDKSRNQASRAA